MISHNQRMKVVGPALVLPLLGLAVTILVGGFLLHGGQPPRTGPATEKRFPPLKVPAGFKATLFACDPLIEYPSAIAPGPKTGSLFVAIDYMTGLGTEIIRRSEVRFVEDTDGDGYADKATVYAKGFNSIQGIAQHNGTMYVMHAPFLTALRDAQGTGAADERKDLLTGLGLTPEQNPVRLHCANGVVVGHDGWLYLALGDHGCDVKRPEGDRLVLNGGGILRCRPDGRDLHVFATGLRNIYDVALDADLNVFVRDNENDGGTYMIRVCHSFYGADHGYPYLYEERPDEALTPLADLGLGSSAGGVCYLERQFPAEFRGNLFFCEWGRSVVRYQPRPQGSTFAALREIEFAAGAQGDPYGFKPTDLVVDRDGALFVSDWADGQRPRRGRGRIYRITHGPSLSDVSKKRPDLLAQLDSESYFERCDAQAAIERTGLDGRKALLDLLNRERLGARGRRHAIWALARISGAAAIDDLMRIAQADAEAGVRAQAVRAVADLADPMLCLHKLEVGPGDAGLARRLAALAKGQDPPVLLEVVVALGRLRWAGAPDWLKQVMNKPDAALTHTAMQTMRRSKNWSAIVKLLDGRAGTPIRDIALRALVGCYEPDVVDGLIARLGTETVSGRRRQYADALTRVYKKPGPWTYWGYRPAPRPANTIAWERTEAIAQALDRALADPDRATRLAVLQRMQREKVPVRLAALGDWLKAEYEPDRTAAILAALRSQSAADGRKHLDAVVRDRRHNAANRLTALSLFVNGLDATAPAPLLALAEALEDGPVLADALRRAGKLPRLAAVPFLVQKLSSVRAEVRAAAMEALGELRADEGRVPVVALLHEKDVAVRRAAAGAAGKLGARQATAQLVALMTDADTDVRRASLESLRLLRAPQAVPLAIAALGDRALERTALDCLGDLGGPEQAAAVAEFARRNPSAEVPAAVVRMLTAWRNRPALTAARRQALDHAVAEIHGAGGILVRWHVHGPVTAKITPQIISQFANPGKTEDRADLRTLFATGTEARVPMAQGGGRWLAFTDVAVAEPATVEFLASSNGSLRVWLNGNELFHRVQARRFQVDSDRFAGALGKGLNRLLVEVGPPGPTVEFHLHFRRKSSKAEHEKLTQAALTRAGNPELGRKVFFDVERTQCLKCHRLGDQGERIGPELTGIGGRFSRIYIVESILEPSRTIAPSYGTLLLSLRNGTTLSGVKVAETETALTLADSQGVKHVLAKEAIETQQPSAVSAMPEGLEKRVTQEEFVDMIAFLVSQKGIRSSSK